jgi:hypothetical protein
LKDVEAPRLRSLVNYRFILVEAVHYLRFIATPHCLPDANHIEAQRN